MNEPEGSSPAGQTDQDPCFDFTHLDWARAGAASRQEITALHSQAAMALLGRPQPHLQSNSTVTTDKGCGEDCE